MKLKLSVWMAAVLVLGGCNLDFEHNAVDPGASADGSGDAADTIGPDASGDTSLVADGTAPTDSTALPDLPPAGVCGNGTLESGENCDDGNTVDDAVCSADCQVPFPLCGNGTKDPGEACDDGNTADGDACSSDCLIISMPCLNGEACRLACLGDASSGTFSLAAGETLNYEPARARVTGDQGSHILISDLAGDAPFADGDEVLIIQMRADDPADVGVYSWGRVDTARVDRLTLVNRPNLPFDFSGIVQVVAVPNYDTLDIFTGAVVNGPQWDGVTGGVLAMRVLGRATIDGQIIVRARGYLGGGVGYGEGPTGPRGPQQNPANGAGGGAGTTGAPSGVEVDAAGGGGGGHAADGVDGISSGSGSQGVGGISYGADDLSRLTMGGGGGVGAGTNAAICGGGGDGGGILFLAADELVVTGQLVAQGGSAGTCANTEAGGAGGGAGGSIALWTQSGAVIGDGDVRSNTRAGGSGGGLAVDVNGGAGARGRVAIHSDGMIVGSSNPDHTALSGGCADP